MDIRQISPQEKERIINGINEILTKIICDIKEVSKDMDSDVLTTQAAAVWVGNNLCNWYNTFKDEMQKLDRQVKGIQAEMRDAELIPQEDKGVIAQ